MRKTQNAEKKGKIRKNAKCEKYGNTKNHENVINAKNGKKNRKNVINTKKCKIKALKFQKRENAERIRDKTKR